MNNLIRNKRSIYICKQIKVDGRIKFSAPEQFFFNYQPLENEGEIIAFGPESNNRLIIYGRPDQLSQFHNFDRCYVFKQPPETPDDYCTDADYYIDGDPKNYINEMTMYLQKMVGDDDG